MDKPVDEVTQKPFRPERAQAIQFADKSVIATLGANGQPVDKQIGYQLASSSVDIDPTFAHGWYVVGNADSDLKLKAAAVAAYRRALQQPDGSEIGDMSPDLRAKTLCNMGHTLYHMGKHEEAMKATLQSLDIDEKMAYTWCNLSLVQSIMGKDEEAIESARRAVKLDPTTAMVEMALAFALLHGKQYAKGLKHMEARFPYKLTNFLSYPYPKWKGERSAELFLTSDQGMGDSIDFLRFVPQAAKRCKKIWLGSQPELMKLEQEMFKDIGNIEYLPLPQPFPPATHWAALMSLPMMLGLSDKEIIEAKFPAFDVPDMAGHWKNSHAKLHVGVAWSGALGNEIDHWRSTTPDQFMELTRVPNVQFYSLQVGDRRMEMHNAGGASHFRDLSCYISNVLDTLSVLKHLDMVICVDTALGHIAGLVDKPAWVLASFNGCCWRFSRHGDRSLWYDNHRIYRQGIDCNWQPVFDRIVADLDKLVNG